MGDTKIKPQQNFSQRSLTKATVPKSTRILSYLDNSRSHFLKTLGASLCLCAFLGGFTLAASLAKGTADSGDSTSIAALEQRLFFKTYDSENEDARLQRLEKQVFGDAGQGDIHSRLQRLQGATCAQENPDGSVSGLNAPPPQAVTSSAQPDQQSRAAQEAEEKADAAQRAQVEAAAQREQQINNLLDQGVQMWRAKQGSQAIAKFNQVLQLDPNNAEANFSLGIALESSNDLNHALNCYKRAAQQKPDNKDYVDAIAAVQKKLAKSGTGLEGLQGELRSLAEDASAAYKRGEYISALDLYKQLDMKAPNEALVKYNIGTLYLAMKNPVNALIYFKQALALKPSDPRYQTAVQQLDTNLRNAQQKQAQVDQAWSQAEQNQTGMPAPKQAGVPAYGTPPGYVNAIPQQRLQPVYTPVQQPPQQPNGVAPYGTPPGMQQHQQQIYPMQQQAPGPGYPQQQPPPLGYAPVQQQQGYPMQQVAGQSYAPMQQQPQQGYANVAQAPVYPNTQMPQSYPMQPQQSYQQPGYTPIPPGNQPKSAKAPKPPKGPANLLPAPTGPDPMQRAGIIAKAGHDGLQIIAVGLASRASKAGLLKGDIIKAVNGTPVKQMKQAMDVLNVAPSGAPIQLIIMRNDKMGQVNL